MRSFDCKKSIEDSIKNWLIMTATATRIFCALKASNLKSLKASLDIKNIAIFPGGIYGRL